MNKRTCVLSLLIFFLFVSLHSIGQITDKDDSTTDNTDELEKILGSGNPDYINPSGRYISATFQSTRIVNGQSIENTGKGVLDFRISHRFGEINEGIQNLYGLDNATTKFDFDYGITDWLCVGIGRSTFEKEYDGFIKAKIIRQTTNGQIPVSVSFCGGSSVQTLNVTNVPGYDYAFYDRVYYFSQFIVARKFNKSLSLQLVPTYLHYNLVSYAKDRNDLLAMGFGGRLKISKRIAITGEYYYTIPGFNLSGYNNSVSLGVDIETGGHVFQLFLTNSANISERTFIGETQGDVLKGDLHLGFNISRVFTIVHSTEFPNANK
jgi:hypothetical protein